MAKKKEPEQTNTVSQTLLEMAELYRPMLEFLPDATVLYDGEGKVVYVNSTFALIFGWELAELQGNRLDFVPEESKEETAQAVGALLRGETIAPLTTRRLTKDGRVIDVQVTANLLTDMAQNRIGSIILLRNITQQKETERALEASQNRYRQMLESTPDAYYEVDLEGNITYYTQSLSEVLGYPEDELIGLNNRDYAEPDSAHKIYEAFNQVFQTGQAAKAVLMHTIRKDGTPQVLETSIALRHDTEGQIVGFRGVARDITNLIAERQEAQEASVRSEEKYREILETIKDGFYEVDLSGSFTFMNEQALDIFGYSTEEFIGLNFREYTPPETADLVYQAFNQVFRTGESIEQLTYPIITGKNEERFIEVSTSLVRNSAGVPVGFHGIVRNVTERMEAETKLRESEDRYRTILDSIEDGYYEADVEGNFIFMNDQLCEVIGYPRHELMGMNYREYTTPETAERVMATFDRVFKTGEPEKGFVWEAIGKDGRIRHLETFVLPRYDEAGRPLGFRGVGRDITQRVQAEEALAEALVDQERIASQLATVAKVSTAVSTILDPQEMLQAVVDQVKESFNLYHAHAYLLNEAGDTLELVAGAGEVGHQMVQEGRAIPLATEQSLVARAARSRSGIIVNDVRKDPHFLPHRLLPDTCAEMAVPMVVGGQVLGVLDLQADSINRFSQRYVNIQTTLATQIAVALQNARLFAQAQQQTTELRETTALLDQVIEILPVGLFMKEAKDLRFVRWNKSNEEIMGLKAADALGKNDYDFFVKEEADFFINKDREVLDSGEMVDIAEEVITTPHRGQRLLHTRKLPIFGTDGAPRYLLGVSEDITERKEAEQVLQESLKMQQILHEVGLELANTETLDDLYARAVTLCRERLGFERVGIFTFETEEGCFKGTFGTDTSGKLTNEQETTFISEEDYLAQFNDARQRVFTRYDTDLYENGEIIGKGWHLTVPLRQSDKLIGVLFSDSLMNQRPLKPHEPDLLAAFGSIVANLMGRKQAETDLRDTNARAQAILESVTTPMVISAASGGQILYANELLAELVGVPMSALLEQGTPDFYVRQEDRTAVVGQIQETGSVTHYELELKRSDGSRFWALLSAQLFNYQNTAAILTTLIDITERRVAQEAVRLSEQSLQESLRVQQTLHEVGLELAKAESLDELFRQTVILGQSHLKFERIGLFMYNKANNQFTGTYGWDLEGNFRNEESITFSVSKEDFETRFNDVRRRVFVEHDAPLYDGDVLIGHGWHLTVPIWKNEALTGALFAQEPLGSRRPLMAYEPELLASYSAILANLMERLQNEQAVQESLRMQQILHEVSLDLSQTQTLDDLFKEAVQLGHDRLDLERFSIYLYHEDRDLFAATFGVDAKGHFRDERGGGYDLTMPDVVEMFKDIRQRIIVAENSTLWDEGNQAGEGWHITVPIRLQNVLYGVMFTDNLVTRRDLPSYLPDLMSAFSSIVGNQIERNLAEQSVAAALAETEHLYTMSARLNAATSVDEILEAVVVPVAGRELMAANLFTLEVAANGRPEWMEMAANWASPDSVLAGVDFPVGSRFYLPDLPTAAQWIDAPDEILLSGDVEQDETLDEITRGLYQMSGVKASATLPLQSGNTWVGLLSLSWSETKNFTEDDRRIFHALTDQAAIIMNNHLLFEQAQKRVAELATMAEVGAAVTSIRDVDVLLQRVVDLAKERFNLYHAHIYLLDEVGHNLVLTSGAGKVGRQMVAEGRIIPLDQAQSLIARAARKRQGIIINDVTADVDFLPHPLLPDTRAEMVVPMIVADEVLGVLDIQAHRINHFSEGDIQIQTTLAAQIGVALQNARSFARSETALKELQEVTRRLRREGWESYAQVSGRNGLRYAYDQKEVKTLALLPAPKRRARKEETPVSTLTYPLQVQGESIGQLMLTEPSVVDEDAQDIMTAVAERLSAHIENLRLTEQTQRALSQTEEQAKRLAMLNEISARLGEAVTLEELYDLAVTRCAELIGADRSSLQMIQSEGQSSIVTAVHGEEVDMPAGTILEMAGSPMEIALRENRVVPTIMGSAVGEGRVAPLYAGGKPLGTLNVGSKRKGFFTERDDNLLLQLATILSSVIDNRRLLGAAEARAGELSVLNEMVGELTTMLDVEPILEAIYRFSSRLMNTTNFYIAMHHSLTDDVSFPVAVEEGKRVLWRTRPFGNGMSEYILKYGQSLFVEDGLEKWLKSQGVESIGSPSQSWMGVPLRIGNEVIGVIALQSLEPRFYTREQFGLLNAVANQAAIAIQNARQFQQEQARAQRQQMLREIAAKVRGSADVDAIMRTAVQEIGQVLGRQTYVYLGDNAAQPMNEDA